jgi:TDG/mug DNA glycosylase family protein
LTDRLLKPDEERELLASGCGITNIVNRATALATGLTAQELIEGRLPLQEKVRRYRPQILAILGIGAYRTAFERPKAIIGKQAERIGNTLLWVLPNPSGINAHYQLEDLARLFRELKSII